MRISFAIILLLGVSIPAISASPVTVQSALKLLPKDQLKNLVRIEAREGDPAPEYWYIQVYNPADENGLHEYVATAKGTVASRSLSQFLEGAKPEDVVGSKLVKVDSDDLMKLVQHYAEANHLTVSKINYTMLKEADNPAPVWRLVCLDDSGKKIAELVVNARNANVVSHDGFENAPGQAQSQPQPSPVAETKPGNSPAGQPTVKPAIPIRPAVAIKPSPSPMASASPQKRAPLFERMFGGKKKDDRTPSPTPASSPAPATN